MTRTTSCVDCAGLAGLEGGVPGLVWLAALDGWTWMRTGSGWGEEMRAEAW